MGLGRLSTSGQMAAHGSLNPAFDDNDWVAFGFSAIIGVVDLDEEGKLANVDTIATD